MAFVLLAASCAHTVEPDGASGGAGGRGGRAGRGGSGGTGAAGTGGFVGSGGAGGSGGSSGGTGGSVAAGGSGGTAAGGAGGSGGSTGGAGGTGGTAGASGGMGGAIGSGGSAGTGGGSGGAGGATGAGGSGGSPSDAGATGFSLRYMVEETAPSGPVMGSQIWIYNNGSETVPLNELSVRYYFTNEVTATPQSNVNWGHMDRLSGGDYTDIGAQATIAIVPMTAPAATANTYVSIGFGGGQSIGPGYRIQLSWRVQNFQSQNYDQTNDYSYNQSLTSEADWQNVVLMRGSTVIFGQEPQ